MIVHKTGNPTWWTSRKLTCSHCDTIFSLDTQDTPTLLADTVTYRTQCPTCGMFIDFRKTTSTVASEATWKSDTRMVL